MFETDMEKTITTPRYFTDLAEFSTLSGLELMQSIFEGRLEGPGIGMTLGFALHSVAHGRIEFRGTPQSHVTNPFGTVHGGWYGTILDSAMACSVQSCLEANTFYTTLEYKINIMRAVPLGTAVKSIGTVDHVGRKTGVASGELRGVSDDKLYATGSTTCIILPKG